MGISSGKSDHRSEGDDELLSRYADGDDSAFGVLVRRHLPLVLSVTRRRLGHSGLAEDAAQEVFIDLSRRAKTRRAIACLPAWLHRAATYEAATAARTESRHRSRVAKASKEEHGITTDSGLDRMLDEALAALPERDRQLLVLHHYERLSYEAIARKLGTTAAAAQRRGHRALEKLAGKMKLVRRDEAACVAWLTAGIRDPHTEVPAALPGKISAAGKAAAFSLPWLSLATMALVLAGAGAWAIATTRPEIAATASTALPSKS
ncbi:MAG TPA: sigma-70 family RNA polymerase sigma factor, partial [Haloferula sp.]